MIRYYLKFGEDLIEVELDVWVAEERRAGFIPNGEYDKFTRTTDGFSDGGEVAGKIVYDQS